VTESDSSVLLLSPPGWSLAVAGPHIAGPLLQGFLESKEISCEYSDLNIGLSQYLSVKITEAQVVEGCRSPTMSLMNGPFFQAQDELDTLANRYAGRWNVTEGFRPDGFSHSSSESVRRHSREAGPYTEYYRSEVLPAIDRLDPDLIGISVSVPDQWLPTFALCRELRAAGYSGHLTLGGNMITRVWKEMRHPWVFELIDSLAIYQGENTLLALIRAVNCGKGLDDVPSLIWKNGSETKVNQTHLLSRREFEGPTFSNVRVNDYWGVPYLPMIGSRGCYYGKCTFCAIPFAWGENRFIGHDEPERVLSYMRTATGTTGTNRFKFVEEAMHPAMLGQLSDSIIEEGFVCEFEGYARFDAFLTKSTFLDRVATAGLRKVYLGLELSPSDTRALMNKSDNAPVAETLQRLHDAGIKSHLFCLFGYPGTGVDEALETMDFVFKYEHLIDTLDIFPFYYAKHTQVEGIDAVDNKSDDWAVEWDYVPAQAGVMAQQDVNELASQLEDLVWTRHPEWLHPIYRFFSPWHERSNHSVLDSTDHAYRQPKSSPGLC